MRFGRSLTAGLVAGGIAAAAVGGVFASGAALAAPGLTELAAGPYRSPISEDQFYFVMTDRYRDGDRANNNGGQVGAVAQTGFDPASESYFHGGDLAGLTGSCDVANPADDGLARIARLGFTAIWVTPPFVQRTVQGDSAAYHGYWFLDLSKPDPHVGTREEFAYFVDCAHRLGIKVFVDVVVNHTADVISYPQGNEYVSVSKAPYRTARGKVFDPFSFAHGTRFPALSATRSFAKTPQVDQGYRGVKFPAVLNEVTRYHNRGDISWGSCVGVCEMDGDFSGLDDLMTEDWTVVKALADAYGSWISDFGIDGFRIDTAKHVDPYFFGRWLPQVTQHADAAAKTEFTSFGEAWYVDAAQLAETMRSRGLPSVLDFPFQKSAREFATGKAGGAAMSMLFAEDDYYTTATTNAYGLTTFLGNHDMGRIGFFLATDTQAMGQELLERDLLAHDLLYLTRGVPVVYYGDEVGMTGSGDGMDKRARQDMFATAVPQWQVEERIGGGAVGSGTSFSETSPIETRLAVLAGLRKEHPALASGAMITRLGRGGVLAVSRIAAAARTEYVVAFNNGDVPATVAIPTSTPSSTWTGLLGLNQAVSDSSGAITVTMAPRSTAVLRAESTLPTPAAPTVSTAVRQDAITGNYRLTATVPGTDPSTVTFLMRKPGGRWTVAGVDDARPFRVFLAPGPGRTQVAAVVTDSAGARASTSPRGYFLKPFL